MARYHHVSVMGLALLYQTTVNAFSLYTIFDRGDALRSRHNLVHRDITTLRLGNDDECPGEEIYADDNNSKSSGFTRRDALATGLGTVVSVGVGTQPAQADGGFIPWSQDESYSPAPRPLAYRVDSTIPPTLLPLNPRRELSTLKNLGKGSGTSKDAVLDNRINFNNMLNKAVYGTIDAVSSVVNPQPDESKSGPGYASFVCMGVPKDTTSEDVELGKSILTLIMQGRNSAKFDTALGLAFAPLSTQAALDAYSQDGDEEELVKAMTKSAVTESVAQLYLPLLRFAQSQSMALLALAPEVQDVAVVRSEGLQNVDVERRAQYVVDSEGFINLTQDPKFRLYTDRSLLKDYESQRKSDNEGNFFAERILVHEAAATAATRYATARPDSLVALVAPIPDVRFLGGINGRIPRVCAFLNKESNKVNEEAVTTILLNPTAKETLSLSRYLRLEIGTAPDTWKYQSKVADYLWFSKMPKVNMIPRLMNG